MLDSAKRLIAPSPRSDVPPFIVMDVMAAAARIEDAGGRVIHMEVGQPAAPAPSTAIEAAPKGAVGAHRAIPRRSASRQLRARIARHYREVHGSRSSRPGS